MEIKKIGCLKSTAYFFIKKIEDLFSIFQKYPT